MAAYRVFCLLLIGCLAIASQARAAADESHDIRVLIVMGGGTYESSVFRFFDTLDGIRYTLSMSDTEAFAGDIRERYDAVLMYNLSTSLPADARDNLVGFLARGGGLVVLHHALANYGDWDWWHRDVVGGRYYLQPEDGRPASRYRQDESILARPGREHPVVASLGGHPMHLYDETYQGLWISPDVQVLLSTTLSSSDGPLVWVGPYDAARVVAIQPGHGSSAYFNLGFRLIVRDALRWVARVDGDR